MKTFTIHEILKIGVCYRREKLVHLFAGRESVTLLDIFEWSIPDRDKVYFAYRNNVLSPEDRRKITLRSVERIFAKFGETDPTTIELVDAARKYLRGEMGGYDLEILAQKCRDVSFSRSVSAVVQAVFGLVCDDNPVSNSQTCCSVADAERAAQIDDIRKLPTAK